MVASGLNNLHDVGGRPVASDYPLETSKDEKSYKYEKFLCRISDQCSIVVLPLPECLTADAKQVLGEAGTRPADTIDTKGER